LRILKVDCGNVPDPLRNIGTDHRPIRNAFGFP
jgi:hypothetical protein